MAVEINEVKVVWSDLKNKDLTKINGSKNFSIDVPVDSQIVSQLREDFKALEKKAVQQLTEQLGKKVKGASREKGLGNTLFEENNYDPNNVRLKFNIFDIKDEDVKQADGTTKKIKKEVLNSAYKNLDFIYKLDSNGKKTFTSGNSDSHWLPMSDNIVNVKASLYAKYNKTDNRVTIRIKADSVELKTTKEFDGKSSGFGTITLEDTNEAIENIVENSEIVKEDETFSADELSSLDV